LPRSLILSAVFSTMIIGVPLLQAENPPSVRWAVFNVFELKRAKLDDVDAAGQGKNVQLRHAAEILQRVRPDIVLINEIDFSATSDCARDFLERYLKVGQRGQAPLDYGFVFARPVNTGVPSGLDLNRDGDQADPEDAFGYGSYPGQYGMAIFSRFPIESAAARTFQTLLWQNMPGHLMPDGLGGRPAYYGPESAARLRLSSKSHWDVPIKIGERQVHLLASHPTPPIFDGAEDWNGRRNFDELRFWVDYLNGGDRAAYIVDDAGHKGCLPATTSFVIMGDLNADPLLGEKTYGRTAIAGLLDHPRVFDPQPKSVGHSESKRQYPGDPRSKTSDYGRIDYALPSRDLNVLGSGVFFPAFDDPLRTLVEGAQRASDHRLVWLDLNINH
jgi:Endonuclease/Exonuclease/phosphatase family